MLKKIVLKSFVYLIFFGPFVHGILMGISGWHFVGMFLSPLLLIIINLVGGKISPIDDSNSAFNDYNTNPIYKDRLGNIHHNSL